MFNDFFFKFLKVIIPTAIVLFLIYSFFLKGKDEEEEEIEDDELN